MIAQFITQDQVYSFMESVVWLRNNVQTAKEYGYSHLAIMDVDNLSGAYHFLEVTQVWHSTFSRSRNDLVKDENLSSFSALSTKGQELDEVHFKNDWTEKLVWLLPPTPKIRLLFPILRESNKGFGVWHLRCQSRYLSRSLY